MTTLLNMFYLAIVTLLARLHPTRRLRDEIVVLRYQLDDARRLADYANKRVNMHLCESVTMLAKLDYLEPRYAWLESERDHYRDIITAARLFERRATEGDKMRVKIGGHAP